MSSLSPTCLLFCQFPPQSQSCLSVCSPAPIILLLLLCQNAATLLTLPKPSFSFCLLFLCCAPLCCTGVAIITALARNDNLGETLVEKFDNFSRIPLSPPQHGNFQLFLSTVSSRNSGKLEQNIQFHIFPSQILHLISKYGMTRS